MITITPTLLSVEALEQYNQDVPNVTSGVIMGSLSEQVGVPDQ